MSHFYGSVQGNRNFVTRCGSKNSGYNATVASWEGAVTVVAWYNEDKEEDWVTIRLNTWRGAGNVVPIYRGPINGEDAVKFIQSGIKGD